MSEAAAKRMSLDEFLRWEDDTDRRWESIDGDGVAGRAPMAEPYDGIDLDTEAEKG